ncbi:MAG: NUDIX domain-containing protein [Burkholderiaceae bacterium]|jgi:8-oxo-dGTP diphosphatase|nr:NUDIX domain-containing protein [Burkholderiaceae bacterium]
MGTDTPFLDVVAGILMREDGMVLMACRPENKPYAGYWEFPGGKVNAGEDLLSALRRELREELGIRIQSAEPWCCAEHIYPHARVHLHFYICRQWQGEPQCLENQAFSWLAHIHVSPLLPSAAPLIAHLDSLRYPVRGKDNPHGMIECRQPEEREES